MALTGLDIYKQLPKTNCGECGSPTCLAFAMQLAAKKTSLDKCPHISEGGRAALEGASAPPVRLVTIGTGEKKVEIGNETVLFRHEETFHHETAIAIAVADNLDEEALKARIEKIKRLQFERVGLTIAINLVAVQDTEGDKERFVKIVKEVDEKVGLPLILVSRNPEVIEAALRVCGDKKPLICAADNNNYQALAQLAKDHSCPLTVTAKNLEELSELTQKIASLGVSDIVLDSGARDLLGSLSDLTQIRRLSLKKSYRPLGYPALAFASNGHPAQEISRASIYIARYAGIVILEGAEPWQVLPLLTLRQNIYTDPQKPIRVEPKIYEVGSVNDKSPVFVTTNFSLTYFTVEGDIEASKMASFIVVVDTEGTSVLTAWAAEKFTAESIATAVREQGIEEKVSHRKLILPGFVAVLSGKLEETLSGWEILVGPRESSGIPAYLKNTWKA